MLAGELAVDYPTVKLDTNALVAARLLASERLPGLVVLDDNGEPRTVLPAFQVLRFVVPAYIQADRGLARVVDAKYIGQMCATLADKQVGDLLPAKRTRPLVVHADDTAMEIAQLMEQEHSPVVAVVDGDGRMLGAITLTQLLDRILPG